MVLFNLAICEGGQKILNNLFEKRSAKNAFSGNYYKPVE